MKLRHLVAFAALLLMAVPASAALRTYNLDGDNSTEFPTDGTILRPNTVHGIAQIDEAGPNLVSLTANTTFVDIVGGTDTTSIPGTTVVVDVATTAGPDLSVPHGGTGSVTTSIDWGALTGWTQTGRLICTTYCPGGCPSGVSSCVPFVGFEGTGPPAPLKSGTFNTDTWTFSGGGAAFSSPSVEQVNLSGGAVTANTLLAGTFASVVPALPLLGVAGLGAALVYLGTRAIRRKD